MCYLLMPILQVSMLWWKQCLNNHCSYVPSIIHNALKRCSVKGRGGVCLCVCFKPKSGDNVYSIHTKSERADSAVHA